MEIQDIERKYPTKKEVIIKRKNKILDFSIKCGILQNKVNFHIDAEKLIVDGTEIELRDLKTMYIWGNWGYGEYACSLEILGKNILNNITLNITLIAQEDIYKINDLFEYFIFSNETNFDKLNSDLYVPLINDSEYIYDYEFRKYSPNDEKVISFENKSYCLMKILPKKYYKKYIKKDYLLYESKFANSNYMDVWVSLDESVKNFKKLSILFNFKVLLVLAILIFGIISIIIDILDK